VVHRTNRIEVYHRRLKDKKQSQIIFRYFLPHF
jgi:hypothetical protein